MRRRRGAQVFQEAGGSGRAAASVRDLAVKVAIGRGGAGHLLRHRAAAVLAARSHSSYACTQDVRAVAVFKSGLSSLAK
jgi:hypothetical protein